mmetsp:Transcript_33932/g.82055  ORF Transcript_33932/g.82055 Transcript_33932/m.82055 type:complete len:107 (-) Transcript_33932:136-456(-)
MRWVCSVAELSSGGRRRAAVVAEAAAWARNNDVYNSMHIPIDYKHTGTSLNGLDPVKKRVDSVLLELPYDGLWTYKIIWNLDLPPPPSRSDRVCRHLFDSDSCDLF